MRRHHDWHDISVIVPILLANQHVFTRSNDIPLECDSTNRYIRC